MATAVEEVDRYLASDLAIHDVLARGILNIRRAARWLIATQGWDTTEEAVVNALRRYQAPARADLAGARHLLSLSTISVRTGLAIIRMPRVLEVIENVRRVAAYLGPNDTLAVVPEARHVTLMIDDAAVPAILDLVKPDKPKDVVRRVTSVNLTLPQAGPLAAAALAVALNTYGHAGVKVVAVYGTLPDASILVEDREASRAYGVAVGLTSGPGLEA